MELVVVCLSRLGGTDVDEGVVGSLLQVIVGVNSNDLVEVLDCNAGTGLVVVDGDTHADKADLGLLVVGDRAGGVEGNSIPHKLRAASIPVLITVGLDELPRGDGTINLESVVIRVNRGVRGGVPAKVVQDCANGLHFEVNGVLQSLVGVDDDRSEEPRAHLVLEDGLSAVVAGVLYSQANEGRVNDGKTGNGSVRVRRTGENRSPGGRLAVREERTNRGSGHEARGACKKHKSVLGEVHGDDYRFEDES